jgi:hypothetical protein
MGAVADFVDAHVRRVERIAAIPLPVCGPEDLATLREDPLS